MTEPNVLTTNSPEWIDAHIEQPTSGSRVQVLNRGGVQCSCIWGSDSILYFDAWQKHLRIPLSVKERQMLRYTKGSL